MNQHETSRTLVKSPPELWAELSDASALARHLDHFGEIRITRLEPETAVAWEGERASGTVRLEPAGWGTRVILTAQQELQAPERSRELPAAEVTDDAPEPGSRAHEPAETPPPPPAVPSVMNHDPGHAHDGSPSPPAAGAIWRATRGEGRGGFLTRVRSLLIRERAPAAAGTQPAIAAPGPERPEPVTAAQPSASSECVTTAHIEQPPRTAEAGPAIDPEAALTAALDSLGQAHHRPFSRA